MLNSLSMDELDRVFSIFIRTRWMDYRGYVRCYTCPRILHWKEMQCGHWLRRGLSLTRWEPDNCRPQCEHCNEYENGQPEVFEAELREELGDERVDELVHMSREIFKADDEWVADQTIHYKKMIAGIA